MLKTSIKNSDDIVRSMRRNAISVFIAVDEDVADDISRCLCQGADKIESLQSELNRLRSELNRLGMPYE